MDFYAVLAQVSELLQREGRVSYRALKVQFSLDDDQLEALKNELIEAKRLAVDERGRVLVWVGTAPPAETPTTRTAPATPQPDAQPDHLVQSAPLATTSHAPEAERRQLTVMFCDLVDSTVLAQRFDPEDYRAVVRAYQEAAVAAIQPFNGYVAQYLGDGLLVYFGYPQAHEDAAQRAVRAGLAIVDAMAPLNARLEPQYSVRVAVRLGLHTGVAVVGSVGSGARLEQLAMGDTPNIAARLQGLAAPDTGEYAAARPHLEQGIALTDPTAQRALVLHHGVAPGLRCLAVAALTLWCLGYPAQAVRRCQEALTMAQALAHPYSLAMAQQYATFLAHRRRDVPAVQAQAGALLSLATAQGFPLFVGYGTCWQGWALAMQGQGEGDLAQMRQGLAALLATGQTVARPLWVILLAEAAWHTGEVAEGLRLLTEVLTVPEASKQGDLLAETYRLQGALLLQQATPDAAQAEACFQQALAIARRQQARSWELRAAVSLSRLWQQQGKRVEAYDLLAPIYGWFTEGFDTADLQDAKALLAELA
jgi:class 3 adenylate cyclase